MELLPNDVISESVEPTVRQYAVVISKGASTYRAIVPDLPGCAAVCRTRAEVEEVIRQAVAGHIRGLQRQGLPVPEPRSHVVLIEG
jgi:predicted RNase H-like HicB family nuclease